MTVNSKEENFCPNYVQEFGLRNNRIILEQERKYNSIEEETGQERSEKFKRDGKNGGQEES